MHCLKSVENSFVHRSSCQLAQLSMSFLSLTPRHGARSAILQLRPINLVPDHRSINTNISSHSNRTSSLVSNLCTKCHADAEQLKCHIKRIPTHSVQFITSKKINNALETFALSSARLQDVQTDFHRTCAACIICCTALLLFISSHPTHQPTYSTLWIPEFKFHGRPIQDLAMIPLRSLPPGLCDASFAATCSSVRANSRSSTYGLPCAFCWSACSAHRFFSLSLSV